MAGNVIRIPVTEVIKQSADAVESQSSISWKHRNTKSMDPQATSNDGLGQHQQTHTTNNGVTTQSKGHSKIVSP